jgi:hypothetical protein
MGGCCWSASFYVCSNRRAACSSAAVHALWCDCKSKSRRETWQKWFERYGRNRIEPVNNRDDVADYCAKYVTKEGSWWNVKLLSHRHPEFWKNFTLSGI